MAGLMNIMSQTSSVSGWMAPYGFVGSMVQVLCIIVPLPIMAIVYKKLEQVFEEAGGKAVVD